MLHLVHFIRLQNMYGCEHTLPVYPMCADMKAWLQQQRQRETKVHMHAQSENLHLQARKPWSSGITLSPKPKPLRNS